MTTHEKGRMASRNRAERRGSSFGIEAGISWSMRIVSAAWYQDLEFESLNAALETIHRGSAASWHGWRLEAAAHQAGAVRRRGYHRGPRDEHAATYCPRGSRLARRRAPPLKLAGGLGCPRTDAGRLSELGYRRVVDVTKADSGRFAGEAAEKRRHGLMAMGP